MLVYLVLCLSKVKGYLCVVSNVCVNAAVLRRDGGVHLANSGRCFVVGQYGLAIWQEEDPGGDAAGAPTLVEKSNAVSFCLLCQQALQC